MNLIFINSSVVLVTQEHLQPVNHTLLEQRGIVPATFIQKNNSIYTPVVSQVYYKNGLSIIVEAKRAKLQFNSTHGKENFLEKLKVLEDISSKYISFLGNINYTAIGINFICIRDDLKYEFFAEKIINKNSPQLNFKNNPGKMSEIKLSYSLKGKQLMATISDVQKQVKDSSNPPQSVTFFDINIHYPSSYADNKLAIVEELEDNYKKTNDFIRSF